MKLCVLGDIHTHWGPEDVDSIDALGYDAVLVVGDLAGYRFSPTLEVAKELARLTTPMWLMPGNHDATHGASLLAEALGRPLLNRLAPSDVTSRVAALREAIAPHTLAAYSLHPLGELTLVAARPHSMGGPRLAFADQLQANWGVATLEQSTDRLCALMEQAPTEQLLVLAHNGPHGLGAAPDAIWGCDFKADGGDWGDPDLTTAIAHARTHGKRVCAVVAGHMHRRTRQGLARTHLLTDEAGTVFVNAAQVPRVRDGSRHHVALSIEHGTATAADVFLPSG